MANTKRRRDCRGTVSCRNASFGFVHARENQPKGGSADLKPPSRLPHTKREPDPIKR